MGTAAGGAATSLEKLPRHMLQAGTPGQHCCSAQGLSSMPASGWSHSPCSSGRCHFGEEPAWHFSQRCTLASFQDLLIVVEEKCIKDLFIYVSKSYLFGVCCRPSPKELSCTSFAAAPHCPVSLLNSQFWSGQLRDKEFLYLGGLTVLVPGYPRGNQRILWGKLGCCFLCSL